MQVSLTNLELVLWTKKDVPERIKNSQTGEWDKTGKTTEMTEYTLRDEFGQTLVFLAGNEYRPLERKGTVRLEVDITYNEWQNKNQVKLVTIESE